MIEKEREREIERKVKKYEVSTRDNSYRGKFQLPERRRTLTDCVSNPKAKTLP